jgi:uncharacterized membrane protein YfcA
MPASQPTVISKATPASRFTLFLLCCFSTLFMETEAFVATKKSQSIESRTGVHSPKWVHSLPVQARNSQRRTKQSALKMSIDPSTIITSLSQGVPIQLTPDILLSTKYAFMLPAMVCVATSCQLAGIGSAALLSPIFLLIFPLLGPEYPLPNPANAIATALLTEVFGFASGLSGYSRKGLVDWTVAIQFAAVSIPTALIGAIFAKELASDVTILRIVYATFMLGLATYLLTSARPEALEELAIEEECDISEIMAEAGLRNKLSADGQSFTYLEPTKGSIKSIGITSSGGILTGLLGVGIGEVMLPQLVRGSCMPLPVAAGTSVAVVVLTALTAAVVQFVNLASVTGGNMASAIPWDLVQYTIPGALIGGQVAPVVASVGTFSDDEIERFAATLFAVVGTAFALKVLAG